MNPLEKINLNLQTLVIFYKLKEDTVIKRFSELLGAAQQPVLTQAAAYSSFVSLLYEQGGNLTTYLMNRVLEDENVYVKRCAQKLPIDETLEECLLYELRVLEEISRLSAQELRAALSIDGYLPGWTVSDMDFTAIYRDRMDHIQTRGYGMYSKYHMFLTKDGDIIPVQSPDTTRLANLQGYEEQRSSVLNNTLALLQGKPAANVLLYGDAGTGKSSTVKAIVNELRDQGLRLIEITRREFGSIPQIAEKLSANPLKFILFIDDLSFDRDNDDFNALKAVLEGSVSTRTSNIAIYATSNRRHMVRESFADREGDDIHRGETIQELISLSERFGLSVNFFRPDKELYLEIVHALARQYGIQMEEEELDLAAERYALRRSGRSPRVARQFMESLKSKQ